MNPIPALLLLCLSATPALARNYDKQAAEAASEGVPGITIFIGATWGARQDSAAREITQAHRAFGAHRYVVVDVEPYTENGDLEGFFVTYRREERASDEAR